MGGGDGDGYGRRDGDGEGYERRERDGRWDGG